MISLRYLFHRCVPAMIGKSLAMSNYISELAARYQYSDSVFGFSRQPLGLCPSLLAVVVECRCHFFALRGGGRSVDLLSVGRLRFSR